MVELVLLSWRKSSKTVLLHLGHLGSSSESITYMRQRGQPTNTMEVASGLLEYLILSSWFSSDDTQELCGEVGDTVAALLGDSTLGLALGGDRLSFRSSFGVFPFRRLMVCFWLSAKNCRSY
ncbi:hypothetical protein O6P43_009633 [Quillaja saponaria]|uniref:Uncharacterized protein n=1 Tax=Quillaja saponaria TaxID=32244 RepID=A0AAD7PYQ3_QUISA|nr:hypothetical protein O6P43_009633 [Quillaja saponaria]